jgi:hypothetical protein
MTWFDWLVFIFCWSLPFAVYAIRRWRLRVHFSRDRNFPRTRSRLVNEGMPAGASEAKDSSPRARPFVVERPRPFIIAKRGNRWP